MLPPTPAPANRGIKKKAAPHGDAAKFREETSNTTDRRYRPAVPLKWHGDGLPQVPRANYLATAPGFPPAVPGGAMTGIVPCCVGVFCMP